MKIDGRLILSSGALLLLLLSGCGATGATSLGRMTTEGFEHSTYDYRIGYASEEDRRLMPAEWILYNYNVGVGGVTGEPKVGPEFQRPVNVDVDGNGENDEREQVYVYDLLFRHRFTGATLWVRSVVASQLLYERELRVVVRDYVDGVAGSQQAAVGLDTTVATERTHRMAARLLHQSEGELDGREAYTSVIDVVNLDQRELTSEAVAQRTRVVIVRPHFGWTPELGSGRGGESMDQKPFFPVLMVIGYSSRPEDFEYHRADYESLLSRVEFGERVDLAVLREPVFACVPSLRALAIDVVVDEEGTPVTLGEDHRWSVEDRRCIERAVRELDFPRSEHPRTYSAVFHREDATEPTGTGDPAYGNPSAPPPAAPPVTPNEDVDDAPEPASN